MLLQTLRWSPWQTRPVKRAKSTFLQPSSSPLSFVGLIYCGTACRQKPIRQSSDVGRKTIASLIRHCRNVRGGQPVAPKVRRAPPTSPSTIAFVQLVILVKSSSISLLDSISLRLFGATHFLGSLRQQFLYLFNLFHELLVAIGQQLRVIFVFDLRKESL